jgi:hypothetical protein
MFRQFLAKSFWRQVAREAGLDRIELCVESRSREPVRKRDSRANALLTMICGSAWRVIFGWSLVKKTIAQRGGGQERKVIFQQIYRLISKSSNE